MKDDLISKEKAPTREISRGYDINGDRRVGLLILQNRISLPRGAEFPSVGRDSLQLIIVALALTIASRLTKGGRPRHVGTR